MDLNIVVISGRLAAKPEVRILEGGSTLVRYLIAARSETPRRRIDVLPVVQWDAPEEVADLDRGDGLWIAGAVQRRFWSDDQNRRGRVEIVAHHVQKRPERCDPDLEGSALAMVDGAAEV
jgi:single-stranded DNA-binding protein